MPRVRWRILYPELLIKNVLKTFKIIQAIAVAPGYSPELEGRSQLPKTHAGYRTWRNHVGTNQEASYMLTSFHNTGRCHLNCWRRKVLQSCECCELRKDQLGKIVSWVQQWHKCFLIGFKVCSIRGNAFLILQIWQIAHRPWMDLLLLFC